MFFMAASLNRFEGKGEQKSIFFSDLLSPTDSNGSKVWPVMAPALLIILWIMLESLALILPA